MLINRVMNIDDGNNGLILLKQIVFFTILSKKKKKKEKIGNGRKLFVINNLINGYL